MGFRNTATAYGLGVTLTQLDAEPANDTTTPQREVPEYKWIHCANEGEYLGHHQGPFELTRQVFETFVRNFREDPQYRAGKLELADGQTHTGGVQPVIQFDYEHASEMPPWEGSIPREGAPACAWALEVAIRNGADGKAQLWAFAHLLRGLRAQIAEGAQRFVSIAFTLDGVHWITGKPIGPCLTSIAITNHPYMRDLTPLAAAARAASAGAAAGLKPSGSSSEAPGGRIKGTGASMNAEEQLTALRARLCKGLNIRTLATDDEIAGAVDEAVKKGSDLESLLEAMGVANAGEALKTVPVLREARDKLAGYVSQIDELLQAQAAADAEVAPQEVGAAMSAAKMTGEGAKKALSVMRDHCIATEVEKLERSKPAGQKPTATEIMAARKTGREVFLREYGVTDPAKVMLTRTLAAGPGDTQVAPPKTLQIDSSGSDDGPQIDLRSFKGNTVQRLMQHLSKTEGKKFDDLPLERRIERASVLKHTAQLIT
jgi:hypothetical protein